MNDDSKNGSKNSKSEMLTQKQSIDRIKPKKKQGNPRKNWALTDYEFLNWEQIFENPKIRYLIVGKEICPKTDRPHNQGYMQFFNRIRMTAIKKIVGSKQIHLGEEISTAACNVAYCKKDLHWVEYGEVSHQGDRNDLKSAAAAIHNGVSLSELARTQPEVIIKFPGGFKLLKKLHDQRESPDWRDLHVTLIIGPTDTNKTRKAMADRTNGKPFKIQGSQLQWWDGYENQETIVIDEYSNNIPIDEMLAILDGYSLRLSTKGSHTYARWKKVYITSNLMKYQIHEKAKPAHREALFRRINTIMDGHDSRFVFEEDLSS